MIDDAANDALDALSSCPCCLLRPQQRGLKTPYTYLGKTEIYSDMLKECFDIRLNVGSEKCGICEVCVGHLRNASTFKLQVQRSQTELRKRLKRALGILDEEPAAAVKSETTDKDGKSDNFLDEEPTATADNGETSHIIAISDEEPDVKTETADEDGAGDCLMAIKNNPDADFLVKVTDEAAREDIVMPEPPDEGCRWTRISDDAASNEDIKSRLAAAVKSEIFDGGEDAASDGLADGNPPVKSEMSDGAPSDDDFISHESSVEPETSDDEATSDEDFKSRARQQLAMACSVRLERLRGASSPRACQICRETFDRESSLATHMREVHGDSCGARAGATAYTCDTCGEQFTGKTSLNEHTHKHLMETSEMCPKEFPKHTTHTGEKAYICQVCSKEFTAASHLIKHFVNHFRRKLFICNVCNKQFSKQSSLIRHNLIHAREKLNCYICKKHFKRKYSLERHIRIHTKPYGCKLCNKKFSEKYSMNKHMRLIHTREISEDVKVTSNSHLNLDPSISPTNVS